MGQRGTPPAGIGLGSEVGHSRPKSARSAHSVIKIAKTSAQTARLILARDLAITVLICFWTEETGVAGG